MEIPAEGERPISMVEVEGERGWGTRRGRWMVMVDVGLAYLGMDEAGEALEIEGFVSPF